MPTLWGLGWEDYLAASNPHQCSVFIHSISGLHQRKFCLIKGLTDRTKGIRVGWFLNQGWVILYVCGNLHNKTVFQNWKVKSKGLKSLKHFFFWGSLLGIFENTIGKVTVLLDQKLYLKNLGITFTLINEATVYCAQCAVRIWPGYFIPPYKAWMMLTATKGGVGVQWETPFLLTVGTKYCRSG